MKTKLINFISVIKKLYSTRLNKKLFLLLSGIVITVCSTALAITTTGTLTITANIIGACSMSVPSIVFGAYNGTVLNQSGNMSVTCTNGAPYWISLSAGNGSGATVTVRKMTITAGATTLNYSLYRDVSRTQVWGTTNGTNTVSGTGSGTAQSITVYGQIPASQPLTVGNYTDTVTATINY